MDPVDAGIFEAWLASTDDGVVAVDAEGSVVLHNPADQEGLQYLAADKAARPIYLNRTVCEADLLLPMTAARLPSSVGVSATTGRDSSSASPRSTPSPSATSARPISPGTAASFS